MENLITRSRDAKVFLIHCGRDLHGNFTRIVAGTNHPMEEAALVLSAYGENPRRERHYLVESTDPLVKDASFASWYANYNLTPERLAEIKAAQ